MLLNSLIKMERKFEGNDRMNSKEKGRIGKKIRKKLEKKSIKNFKSVNLMKLKIKNGNIMQERKEKKRELRKVYTRILGAKYVSIYS